ncbi:MAG: DUF4325 domain-containing protein [Candidatus Uhrbacteria bacterium]
MRIDVSKFGTILLSRPAGHEAFLSARAYMVPKENNEPIELDFSQVKVLTPSWTDEFVRGFKEEFGVSRIKIIEGNNLSVKTTFETLNAL